MILYNLLPFTTPILNANPNPNLSLPQLSSRPRRLFPSRCRRGGDSQWDSNAESYRFRFRDEEEQGGGFRERSSCARRWWSDEPEDEFDDEFDPFEEDSENIWDKIWIFKVFKAYGYMLPAIIGTMLLTTGPKAFLLALALPLGQSLISLAIEKLWVRVTEGPGSRPRTKRKPFSQSSSNFKRQEKGDRRSAGKGRSAYQSWASADSGVAGETSSSKRSSFGGWDEFDNENRPAKREPPTSSGSVKDDTLKKGKLSKRGRYRDAPLFVRLLIAVFPFLGSWTRIL